MNENGQGNSEEQEQLMVEEHSSGSAETCKTAKSVGIPPPLYDDDAAAYAAKQSGQGCKNTAPSYSEISLLSIDDPTVSRAVPTILPSYSAVMKSPSKGERCFEKFNPPTAPPTYSEVPGVYVIPSAGHLLGIHNMREPLWRACSQTAYCHRCDATVVTLTRTHESLATHVAALALCLFGCWPCCLLPYCLNSCKNTYHLCPICKGYLGAYTPW